jgi:pimeloyl-ACP methyl ester carboxylesterase
VSATVLLLHGQPGSARDWDGVVRALPAGVRALAIDRPGWDGRSGASELNGNARAALAALDDAGAGAAVIAGHSFGAAVAAWLAAFWPGRVSGLVLIAPAANQASLSPLDRWLALPLLGLASGSAALAGVGVALSSRRVRRLAARGLAIEERALRASGAALRRPRTWRAFAVEQRGLLAELPRLEAELHRITAPTSIVIGTADRIVAPESARLLARQIPHARLVEVRSGSHLLPHQHPRRLAAEIAAVALADGYMRKTP